MTFHVMKRKSHDVFLFLSLFLGPPLDLSQVNFLYIKMRTCGKRPIPYWPYAYLGGLFGIDECLSCWRNSGRFGFLRNCFSEVGEVCLLTPNLRLGLGESNKSQLKLYLLQQGFLRHSWRGNCREMRFLGEKTNLYKSFTMIYGSEISQLRYISNFSKIGSCSHEDHSKCFFWVPRWKIIDSIVIFLCQASTSQLFCDELFFNSPLDTWWHVVPQISSTQIIGSISDLRLSRTHRRNLSMPI